jgi:radical SAM superfamily enzyme YgiQ (UPF0313 family)
MDKQILSQEAAVDIVVRGEGEQTLLELAQHSANSDSFHEIDGITFKNNDGQIIQTPNRDFIQNLDELPFPAYKYIPLEKYKIFGKTHLPVMTSRGCPYQCAFCVASQVFGAKFRARSPKNVVDEIEWLRDVHGADGISFQDDTLTIGRNRILEICEEMKNRNIDLPWDCRTRVDQVSKEVLTKMREAHCREVAFGIESGSQKMLDTMKKGTTVEQNERAIKWAKEAGISVAIYVMVGYPGETRDTVKQTLDFVRRVEPDGTWLCIAVPYPGSELHALVESLGWKMAEDWSLYDSMNTVFENPLLPGEEIRKIRGMFYDNLYSPRYILRHAVKGYLKGNYYSKIMARTALNHMLWRIRH